MPFRLIGPSPLETRDSETLYAFMGILWPPFACGFAFRFGWTWLSIVNLAACVLISYVRIPKWIAKRRNEPTQL